MIAKTAAIFHDFAKNPHSSECGSSQRKTKLEAFTRLSILIREYQNI